LPYREDLFIEDSIRVKDNEHWLRRFHDVKRDASEVITATQQRLALGGVSYTYGNRVLHGLALIKARQLQTDLKYLAVWNGVPGDGPGGTADVIAEWEKQGRPIEKIDLKELLVRFAASKVVSGDGQRPPAKANRPNTATGRTVTRSNPDKENVRGLIAAILFADVANFSKLNEDQIVHFVDHFLGLVHRVAKATVSKEQRRRGKTGKSPILKKNTWGDGLYFAFDSVRVAGLFALDLSDEVEGTKWSEKYHLPPLRIRIGLHAGPVFFCKDPLLGWNCMGTHVSHGARIEPITPKGEVYASREFAALSEAELVKEFSCHYAGEREYAKKYGVFPIYYLERS
jgi:class 3 adenylate cyclase